VRRGPDQALDDYLILLAQGGSHEAFARLAARWTPKLMAFAARSLGTTEAAKDATQETWESAWRNLRRLDDPARFRAWLYAIAARKCADALRTKYRGQRLVDAVTDDLASAGAPDAETQASTHLDLAAAIKRLPPDQRVMISLFFGDDMSVAEIAHITGVPSGTVKSRLFAARQTLRALLEGEKS
jgi:RNA polymerase sigma-70 factor, ECF subfamily